jgi:hypothetical protein
MSPLEATIGELVNSISVLRIWSKMMFPNWSVIFPSGVQYNLPSAHLVGIISELRLSGSRLG